MYARGSRAGLMGTYHDGEGGGVHCQAEYDAEDAVEHPEHAVEQRR